MANGQSIVIKGEITGNEDLVIAGRVEGSIKLGNRVLTLAAGSQVTGDIVAGQLTAPVLVIAEGAQVSAEVEMPARDKRPLAVAV